MPHLQVLHWDYQDQLTEVELNGTGDRGYYNYDGSGQRVRKVVVKSGKRTERLYLGGVERYREYSTGGTIKLERWTVQIDDIAQVDTLTIDNSVAVTSPVPLVRYQYRDHLGSAAMETNENGQVISYEDERTIFAKQNEGLVDLQVREPQSGCILLGLLLIGRLSLALT